MREIWLKNGDMAMTAIRPDYAGEFRKKAIGTAKQTAKLVGATMIAFLILYVFLVLALA